MLSESKRAPKSRDSVVGPFDRTSEVGQSLPSLKVTNQCLVNGACSAVMTPLGWVPPFFPPLEAPAIAAKAGDSERPDQIRQLAHHHRRPTTRWKPNPGPVPASNQGVAASVTGVPQTPRQSDLSFALFGGSSEIQHPSRRASRSDCIVMGLLASPESPTRMTSLQLMTIHTDAKLSQNPELSQ